MNRVAALAAGILWLLSAAHAAEPIRYEKPTGAENFRDEMGRFVSWKTGMTTNYLKVYPPNYTGEQARPAGYCPLTTDREFNSRSAKTPAEWEKVRAQIRKQVTSYFGDVPDLKLPLDAIEDPEADKGDYVLKEVAIAFNDEFRGKMVLVIPKGMPTPAPAILLYDAWGGGIQRATEGVYSRALAIHMARQGFVVVAMPHWNKIFGKRRDLCTMGATVHFTRRAINYLLTKKQLVHPDQIAILGHVYGAEIAQFAAAMDDRIAAVVASCSWLGPTRPYSSAYWDPPFWADGRAMGSIIQCVERASPEMYQSRRRVNYRPLPFLTQELLSLIPPRPYLAINHLMGAGRSATADTSLRECLIPVYNLYKRPWAMELIEHRWGTNEPVNARDFTTDFLLRAMCGIRPGHAGAAVVKEVLADLRSGDKAKQLRAARKAAWWRIKEGKADFSKMVGSADAPVRRAGIKALERTGDMNALFKHVAHKDPVVRMTVIEAMQLYGTEETFEILAENEMDRDRWTKEAKWQTLQVNPWE